MGGAGERRELAGHSIFTLVAPALEAERDEPLLVLHGFPSSSYDFAAVLDDLRRTRRVLLLDFLGYGLSVKPDQAYRLAEQADIVSGVARTALGIERLALLTHDMGDTVGGELLARQLDGTWPVEVTAARAHQREHLHRHGAAQPRSAVAPGPARRDDGGGIGTRRPSVQAGLAATSARRHRCPTTSCSCSGSSSPSPTGHRLLPRLIRYIEERRRDDERATRAPSSRTRHRSTWCGVSTIPSQWWR